MDEEKRLCDICQMEDDECIECDQKTGRRKNDTCESHVNIEEEKEKNILFKTQMKAGIAVGAFFLITFMGWIASSNYISAQDIGEKQKEFERIAKQNQVEHKQDVSTALNEMKTQVYSMVNAVNRMENSIEILVKTTEYTIEKAKEEREANRAKIDELQRKCGGYIGK